MVFFAFHIFALFGGIIPPSLDPLVNFIGVCNILGGISYDPDDGGIFIVSSLILVTVNMLAWLRILQFLETAGDQKGDSPDLPLEDSAEVLVVQPTMDENDEDLDPVGLGFPGKVFLDDVPSHVHYHRLSRCIDNVGQENSASENTTPTEHDELDEKH